MTWRARFVAMLALVTLPASLAHAGLRSPQVPVSGTALATFFASQGQVINVNADQLDMQRMTWSANGTQVDMFGPVAATFGIYNAALSAPPLYLVAPGQVTNGWIAVMSFRTAPVRVVVNLFDASSSLVGTTTYLGADRTDLGVYASSAGGLFYSQDERNPGGLPRILAYAGTGVRAGSVWFVCETSEGPGGDFADAMWLAGVAPSPVPVVRTDWGRLKQLFR